MKKVKMFFVAASLLLVTAGVFAGKENFQTTPSNLYYNYGINQYAPLVTGGGTFSNLVISTSSATIKSGTTTQSYSLFTNTGGSNYSPVNTSF